MKKSIGQQQILRGFDLLRTRTIESESNTGDVVAMPKLYETFYETFEVGRDKMRVPGVFLSQVNQIAGLLEQNILCEHDFVLYDFLSVDEARVLLRNAYDKDDIIHGNYWPIGDCASNKTLLVGISSDNSDVIFLENLHSFNDGTRFKRLAKDIFSFMKIVSYIELEKIGYGINSYSQLYKNWGEEFWRIKDGSNNNALQQ